MTDNEETLKNVLKETQKLRKELGITQEEFLALCKHMGWNK